MKKIEKPQMKKVKNRKWKRFKTTNEENENPQMTKMKIHKCRK